MAVCIIKGADGARVDARAKEFLTQFCPVDQQAYGLEVHDGRVNTVSEALDLLRKVIEGLDTIGFFGADKLIWIKHPEFLGDNPVGKSQDVRDAVKHLADRILEDRLNGVHLLISGDSVHGRSALSAAVKKMGKIEEFSAPTTWNIDKESGPRFTDACRKQGFRVSSSAVDRFLECAAGEARTMASEMEKLFLYCQGRDRIEEEDVRAVVSSSRETPVWNLIQSVSACDAESVLALLEQFKFQKEPAMKIIYSLERGLQTLLGLRICLDRGWLRAEGRQTSWQEDPACEQLMQALPEDLRKLHGLRLKGMIQDVGGLSQKLLMFWQRQAVETHRALVSSQTPDYLLLELMVLKMMEPFQRRKKRA